MTSIISNIPISQYYNESFKISSCLPTTTQKKVNSVDREQLTRQFQELISDISTKNKKQKRIKQLALLMSFLTRICNSFLNFY
jgi:hypothetical protein